MSDEPRRRSKWDEEAKPERSDRGDRSHRDDRHREDRDRERHSSHRDSRDRERDRSDRGDRDRDRGERHSSGRSRWDDTAPIKSPLEKPSRSRSPSRSAASPAVSESKTPAAPKVDPAAAAAAAAARINALINSKKGITSSDPNPIKMPKVDLSTAISNEVYIADGDYIKDIEVNDLRNRYTLTKGSTQKMIKEETGADVTTRGAYYPDKAMATAANPPLYLHVTSTTKEGLDKAVAKIDELMKQELGSLVDERRFRRREPVEQVERDEYGRRKWPEERVYIGLEPIPGFNLRASVVGHQGAYVKHIQQETRCRVQIKGKNSGFMENGIGRESDEEMYLHVTGPDPKEVENARQLCEDLVKSVAEQYEQHKTQPAPQRFPGYGHQHNNSYGGGGGGGRGDGQSYGHQQHQSPPPPLPGGDSQSPLPPPPGGPASVTSPTVADYTQAANYNPYTAYGQPDPYAAYGGYQAYAAYYAQYMAAQQAAAGAPPGVGVPPGMSAPPGAPPGSYNAAPPPPGL